MTRTKEQVAVDEALRETLTEWLRCYGWSGSSLLTDFVIVGALQGYDDDGDLRSEVFVSHAEAGMPRYRMRGLLQEGVFSLDQRASVEDFDEDDD